MPRLDLTDRFVATIKTKKIVDYFDAKTTGLGLRVSPDRRQVVVGYVHHPRQSEARTPIAWHISGDEPRSRSHAGNRGAGQGRGGRGPAPRCRAEGRSAR